jgi:hypothetical protein
MGNDGGSIPGRKDLVKEKGKERRVQNNELVKQSQSRYCALTKDPLKKPVVGDRLGLLYNKESLIKALIEKRLPKSYSHISSLKDLKDLNIKFSDESDAKNQVDQYIKQSDSGSKIACPITMMEFSGLNNFYIIWKCGCVLSKKAIDELNMKLKNKCVNCGTSVDYKNDLVSLNYSAKEKEALFNQILEEKSKLKEKKLKEKYIREIENKEGETKHENTEKIKNEKNEKIQKFKNENNLKTESELDSHTDKIHEKELLSKKRELDDEYLFDINSNKKRRIEINNV